jgi:2-methylisocitrate lyase-like PEP mutase family enzyme
VGLDELRAMKFGMVLYANAALQGAIVGMQAALKELKATGKLDETSKATAGFGERQRLVQKPLFDALEKKYAVK